MEQSTKPGRLGQSCFKQCNSSTLYNRDFFLDWSQLHPNTAFSLQVGIYPTLCVPSVDSWSLTCFLAYIIGIILYHNVETHTCLEVGVQDEEFNITCSYLHTSTKGNSLC